MLKLENLTKLIQELLANGRAFRNLAAHFEDCSETYKSIPLSVVNICLQGLLKKIDHDSEFIFALQLAKVLLNSEDHADAFIDGDGLEKIYYSIEEE